MFEVNTMVRKYDSRKRRMAAEQTRRDILETALKLHWEGVTEFEPLARQAGCSMATLRKHFPNKEALYQSCTSAFSESLKLPDPAKLRAITIPETRTQLCVSELCRIHESMLGYAWLSAHHRKDSPTLDSEMRAYERLTGALANLILPADSPEFPLVRGLLDFLSYRALRLSGALSPERAKEELTKLLQEILKR
jgi:AcrR family transcriptional regulator